MSDEAASTCPPVPAAELGALEGVYELMGHRRSAEACDMEGESVLGLDTERLFVIVQGDLLGSRMGVLQSCSELAECRAKVAFLRDQGPDPSRGVPELQHLLLCGSDAPSALVAREILVGSGFEGTCDVAVTETTATRAADGALRLESRTFAWQKPLIDDGCSYDHREKPADAACSALEVVEARLVSAL